MASFSCGRRLALSPLVLDVTNTFAPSHPRSPSTRPIFSSSSCQPHLNSSFLGFLPCLHLQIASQIPFPTTQTASGLYLANFSSSIGVPAAISSLLNSAASLLGRSTMFVFPMAYRRGRSTSSVGSSRLSVQPELCKSFQNRFEGCAYAWPAVAVRMPGLVLR